MKKIFTIIFPILLLLITSCSNECQDLLDQVQETKAKFEATPTNANCLNYHSALTAHLNSACQSSTQGVNYQFLFQDELDGLQCDTFPTAISTCANGVQDAGETGVDCGGACQPCGTTTPTCTDGILNGDETGVDCGGANCSPCSSNNNFYYRFKVDGVQYEAYPGIGGLIDDGPMVTSSGRLMGFSSFDQNQVQILNFDEFLNESTYSFVKYFLGAPNLSVNEASMAYFEGSFSGNSISYYSFVGSGGTLEINDVDMINNTVSGTFSTKLVDFATELDTIIISDGEFFVPIEQ